MTAFPSDSAASLGLASCHVCYKLAPEREHRCPRCGSALHLRVPDSIQRTVALLITAAVLYVPANVLPIMTTDELGRSTESTIIGVARFPDSKKRCQEMRLEQLFFESENLSMVNLHGIHHWFNLGNLAGGDSPQPDFLIQKKDVRK